jgi:hypothetical protein
MLTTMDTPIWWSPEKPRVPVTMAIVGGTIGRLGRSKAMRSRGPASRKSQGAIASQRRQHRRECSMDWNDLRRSENVEDERGNGEGRAFRASALS